MPIGKRVVVTGGSGRVGRYVLAELANGHQVVNADLSDAGAVEYVRTDVMQLDSLRTVFAGSDVVVHLAAIDYDWRAAAEEYIRVNTLGTWNVLQAAVESGVRRVVLCSSVAAIGLHDLRPDWTPRRLPVDDTHEARPVDAYSVSKTIIELMGRSFVDSGALEVVCLRPCTVVFEENLADFTESVDGGPYLSEYVTGEDVAAAFRAAVEVEVATFGPFLLSAADSSHPEPTLSWYATRFGGLPAEVDVDRYDDNPRASVFSSDAALAAFGWRPTSTLADLKRRHASNQAATQAGKP